MSSHPPRNPRTGECRWLRPLSTVAGLIALLGPGPGQGQNVGTAEAKVKNPHALVVEQRVTGHPDLEKGEVMRQRITIDLESSRLLLEALTPDGKPGATLDHSAGGASRVILRMDREPPVIYEIFDEEKAYRAHEGDLNRLQEERDIQEMNDIRLARRLPRAEREQLLQKNYLRPDGSREVEVRRGETREILGYECREVTITENGRPVIEAWMTTDLAGGKSFYELYRRLGAFSQQVLEKVATLEGLPIRARIKVVTALPAYELEAECTRVQPLASLAPDAFELPAEYREIQDVPPYLACPVCGKEVERDAPGARYFDFNSQTQYLLCSRECYESLRAQLEKRGASGDRK